MFSFSLLFMRLYFTSSFLLDCDPCCILIQQWEWLVGVFFSVKLVSLDMVTQLHYVATLFTHCIHEVEFKHGTLIQIL